MDWRIGHVPRAPSAQWLPWLVGEHEPQFRLIGRIGDNALMQFLLALVRFGGQDVASKSVIPNHFTRPRLFEPLGRTFVCLQLRHRNPWIVSSGKTLAV